MKKKRIVIIIPIVLLVLALVFYIFVPSVYKWAFYIKHIIVYMLVAYLVLLLGYFSIYYNDIRFSNKPRLKLFFKIFNIVVTIFVLILSSNVQTRLIESYEVPEMMGCVYFDRFDNVIFSSRQQYSCAELNILVDSTSTGKGILTFEVEEISEGEYTDGYSDSYTLLHPLINRKVESITTATYTYQDKRIIGMDMTMIEYDYTDDVKVYSTKKSIENVWDSNDFISIQSTGSFYEVFDLEGFEKDSIDFEYEIYDRITSTIHQSGVSKFVDGESAVNIYDSTFGSEIDDLYAEIENNYNTDILSNRSMESSRLSVFLVDGNNSRTNEEILYWVTPLQASVKFYLNGYGKHAEIGYYNYMSPYWNKESYQIYLSNYSRIVNGTSAVVNEDNRVRYYIGGSDTSYSSDNYIIEYNNKSYGTQAKYYGNWRNQIGQLIKKDDNYIQTVHTDFLYSSYDFQDYIKQLDSTLLKQNIGPYQYNPLVDGYSPIDH